MSSPIAKQQAFFSIRRLTEMTETGVEHRREETIDIYLVLNGEATIGGKEFSVMLDNNNLYCITGNRHGKASIKINTEGYLIRFNNALLHNGAAEFNSSSFSALQTLVLKGRVMRVADPFLSEGKKICEMMLQEFEHENEFKLQILSGFLNIFLFHLMRKLDTVTCNTGNESSITLLHKFNVLVEQKFRTNKKVSDYAAWLFVSPNYLSHTIKQATGKSAGVHIRQRIALEAVRQARLTGASMKEVAYALGFSDNAHFSKFFKKTTGKNFTEIRKYLFNKTMVSFDRI